jgi:hypothetical protein
VESQRINHALMGGDQFGTRTLVTGDAPFDQGGFARIGPRPADGTRVFHGFSRISR